MRINFVAAAAILLAGIVTAPASAQPVGTDFTYQGELKSGGQPAGGAVDLTFRLFDQPSGGAQLGTAIHLPGHPLDAGRFTVQLDFGQSPFAGQARWLEVAVNGTTLTPRQPITAAPYALYALAGNEGPPGPPGPAGDSHWTFTGNSTFFTQGRVGIGTASPAALLHIAESTDPVALNVAHAAPGGAAFAARLSTQSGQGTGLMASALATSGDSRAGHFENFSTTGIGVFSWARAASGNNQGGWFQSSSTTGRGIFGLASSGTGVNAGGWFESDSISGRGVVGRTTSSSGTNYAGMFLHQSIGGAAVFASSTASVGQTSAGHFQNASSNGNALFGWAQASVGQNYGGWFQSSGHLGRGVYGLADSGIGPAVGGWFDSDSSEGTGMHARVTSSTGATIAVRGEVQSPGGFAAYFTGVPGSRNFFERSVGIGVAPLFQLHLSENSAAKPTSNTWTISSDARLKKNIQPIEAALDRLLALRGVTYQWNRPEGQGGMTGTYTGMIAQEVEQIFPEWVGQDAAGFKTLTVIGFEGLVVESLRQLRTEHQRELAALAQHHAAEIRARDEALASQRAAIEQLLRRVEALEAQGR